MNLVRVMLLAMNLVQFKHAMNAESVIRCFIITERVFFF